MKRLLTLFLTICIFGCCDKPELLDNGLTESVSDLTEYTIQVKQDSTGNRILDTLVKTKKTYNNLDKIISRYQYNIFADENIDIDFTYDKERNLIKETVGLSKDSKPIIVSYTNENSKLKSSYSESEYDDFYSKQVGNYEYSFFGKMKESTLSHLFIDIETKDTITNTFEVSEFKDELVTTTNFIDHLKPERNRTLKYEYDCGTLTEMKTYNHKDSLISNTKYEYELDEYENWITKNSFENGNLTYIQTRIINYK
ncbi:hypothetical protein [uncultured Psychroserpens sp.]|uniref:hypothetical protein n=1 Tax=uncultured Psychroserpens sp. TaxID=255436 RepID=UPI00260CF309|nr:hypothetical protein [uncultured Psychroserpens sp.]